MERPRLERSIYVDHIVGLLDERSSSGQIIDGLGGIGLSHEVIADVLVTDINSIDGWASELMEPPHPFNRILQDLRLTTYLLLEEAALEPEAVKRFLETEPNMETDPYNFLEGRTPLYLLKTDPLKVQAWVEGVILNTF